MGVPRVHEDFEVSLACDEEYHRMFGQIFHRQLRTYNTLYKTPYLGMHVRHGDKASAISVFSFQSEMAMARQTWPHVRSVFVSTDDQSILSDVHLSEYRNESLTFRWTTDEKRWFGG